MFFIALKELIFATPHIPADIAAEAQVAGERKATVICFEEDAVCDLTMRGDIGVLPTRDRDQSIPQRVAPQRGDGGGHLRARQVGGA